jgi:hypothetical protein
MFKRLRNIRNILWGLTKNELKLMDPQVVVALHGIRNNPKQIEYAKKAVWILEVVDE